MPLLSTLNCLLHEWCYVIYLPKAVFLKLFTACSTSENIELPEYNIKILQHGSRYDLSFVEVSE